MKKFLVPVLLSAVFAVYGFVTTNYTHVGTSDSTIAATGGLDKNPPGDGIDGL